MGKSGLWHLQRLADHEAPVDQEHADDRVKLEGGTRECRAERDVVQYPTIVHPVCHDAVEAKRRWDRGAFEVLGLARCVLGEQLNRDVEPGEARETAENVEGQKEVVQRRAHANSHGATSGRDTERDLGLASAATARDRTPQDVPGPPASPAPDPSSTPSSST